MEDWKAKLAAMAGTVPQVEEETTEQTPTEDATPEKRQTAPLKVVVDKKGRKGKVATIVEGFTLGDDEVDEIASRLKRKIGTGGSSRCGEILLQGEWREKTVELLKSMGFKAI